MALQISSPVRDVADLGPLVVRRCEHARTATACARIWHLRTAQHRSQKRLASTLSSLQYSALSRHSHLNHFATILGTRRLYDSTRAGATPTHHHYRTPLLVCDPGYIDIHPPISTGYALSLRHRLPFPSLHPGTLRQHGPVGTLEGSVDRPYGHPNRRLCPDATRDV